MSLPLRHCLRTVAAALLALGLAYLFELETPYSAATTVLIVAHPMHGMVLSKSFYRLGGTLVGAVMAILLMGLFAQTPQMFMLFFGLWMGLCTLASTLLRSFRSYAAVLAGYTVALITMPGVDNPERIFDLAINRVSVVGLGIACSALVASLTSGRRAEEGLQAKLAVTFRHLCAYARQSLEGVAAPLLSQQRRSLAAEIAALDAQVEFAAIETAVGMADLEESLRAAAMAMYGVLTTAASVHEALARLQGEVLPIELTETLPALLTRLEVPASSDEMKECRLSLLALRQRLEEAIHPGNASHFAIIDRLDELTDELVCCLDAGLALAGAVSLPEGRKVRIWRHRDVTWGMINGLRACVTVWAAGLIWYATGWPAGSIMVAMVVPNIGLLAMRDRPVQDSISFVWGTLLASAVGWVYLLFILPNIEGFPALAVVLSLPLAVGVMLSMNPKTAFVAIGFYVFFITLLAPGNPMTYAPEVFLNNALATIAGAALTAVFNRLILPIDPKRHVRALVRAIQSDLQGLLKGGLAHPEAWEGRMHERLIQLGARMRAAGVRQDSLMRGGFAALRLGRELSRVHALLAGDRDAQITVDASRRALSQLSVSPHAALNACREDAEALSALAQGREGDAARAPLRAAASLGEIAVLVGRHRRFFQRIPT